MAGGEKAKSSGEYGEQIVKNILELMGWNNANSGVTVPCVHKEKHKKENSKEPQKHGIDYVYTYKSQLRDATKQDVLVSVKCRDGYPATDSINDSMLKFAVIIARHNGKWVFCKHKERNTWEAPGGHREDGEDILETAKRELYEETGAITFDITPICIYSVTAPDNFDGMETFGKLFFSDIHTFEKELHSEIEKIAIMDELPINWTYPEIQPKLIEEARKRGFCPKKDEIKWLFFDVGSTLVDESKVYEDRMKRIADLSGLTYEQINKYAMSFYKENKKGDLEVARQLGVKLPKWESQYERLYTDTKDCLKKLIIINLKEI